MRKNAGPLREHYLSGNSLSNTDFDTYLNDQKLTATDIWRSNKQYHKDGTAVSTEELIEQSSKNALKHRIGNCGELTEVLLLTLKYSAFLSAAGLRGKMITINPTPQQPHGDHAFAILYLGNDTSIDNYTGNVIINDLKNTNAFKHCVICDPWIWRASRINNTDDMNLHEALVTAFGVSSFYSGQWSAVFNVSPTQGQDSNQIYAPAFTSLHSAPMQLQSTQLLALLLHHSQSNRFKKYADTFRPVVEKMHSRLKDLKEE
ncbi:hypothetical protein JYJ95_10695 [Corallococcus exiguus]|uniref:hypothetical protein n=1 Tax=Corallococcus exiguus TaxID=83462 RepID=UPI001A8DE013|nr:hypothetical protein [Corallococcus exiguus]MBN8466984.1 hypothetical protein [Corallococcus exiguus]